MDNVQPCNVCGGTDLNLIDGFYYCTECGTQDTTVREMIIEYATRDDGTLAFQTQSRKIFDEKDTRDLDPEWYKWHASNLMMAGFGEELASLGAGEGFQLTLLWVWMRYVHRFRKMDKDKQGKAGEIDDSKDDIFSLMGSEAGETNPFDIKPGGSRKYRINKLIMPTMQAILYTALNISNSDIQVGDLRRFIKEERVSCANCLKFIPEDFNLLKLDPSDRFLLETSSLICDTYNIRGIAMALFKELNLGNPRAPDVFKLVDRYVDELELPKEFKEFVHSLINFIPVSLHMDYLYGIPRTLDYEGVAMAYIVIALKICFGLDGEYENTLSSLAEEYNSIHECRKVYKFDIFNEKTNRLFSFREWMIHTEYKKVMVAKYYFPVALHNNKEIDPQVFLSHTKDRTRKKGTTDDVSEEVMMEILDRLNPDIDSFLTPKINFPPSLTPMKTYTDTILAQINNPYIEELLGEDFTRYSLEYILGDLVLTDTPLSGVSPDNFIISDETMKRVFQFELDTKMVYVRNYDNKDWVNTKPPKMEHIKISDEEGYMSDEGPSRISRSTSLESKSSDDKESVIDVTEGSSQESKLLFEENSENIFNDDFNITRQDLWGRYIKVEDKDSIVSQNNNNTDLNYDIFDDNLQDDNSLQGSSVNLDNFDREAAIEMLLKCEEVYIGETIQPKPRRKREHVPDGSERPKRKRDGVGLSTQRRQAKLDVESILNNYFTSVVNSVDSTNTEHCLRVNTAADESSNQVEENESILNNHLTTVVNSVDSTNMEHDNVSANDNNIDSIEPGKQETAKTNDEINDFDKTQLYLRVNTAADESSNQVEENDSELNELFNDIEQRHLEDGENSIHSKSEKSVTNKNIEDKYGPDETSAEIHLKEFERAEKIKRMFAKVKNKDKFKHHNYWMLHYYYVSDGFDRDLDVKFSKSFVWLFRLCASIIESPTRALYKQVINLENELKRALKQKYP